MATRNVPDKFLVAFSLAGEQRVLVRAIAELVEQRLGRSSVFFDEWFEHYIAGSDADIKLQNIYAERCVLAVVCVSDHYEGKPWTAAEHEAIRSRQMKAWDSDRSRHNLGILHIRVGDGEVRGIPFNTIIPDVRARTAEDVATLIIDRLKLIVPDLRGQSPRSPAGLRTSHAREAVIQQVVNNFTAPDPTQVFQIPFGRNPTFTGRIDVLERLREQLTTAGTAALSQIAISGLGGIGKTQTAVEYAYRYRSDYTAVLWALADTDQSLAAGYVEIARALELPEANQTDATLVRESTKRWLESVPGWLLVLDNADRPELLQPYLPLRPLGHVLVTSRRRNLQSIGIVRPIQLEKLDSKEALEFLFRRTGRDGDDPAETRAAGELAAELDYLPLALEQAAAYVTAMDSSFQTYLQGFHKRRLNLMSQPAIFGGRSAYVKTVWQLNFAEVERTPEAADLLRLTAYLAPEDVPLDLLAKAGEAIGPTLSCALATAVDDPTLFDVVMEPITRYSLARRGRNSVNFSVHRLVQFVLRDTMTADEQRHWAIRAVETISAVFPRIGAEEWLPADGSRLITHAIVCSEWIRKWDMRSAPAGYLLRQAGYFLYRQPQYDWAEKLLSQAHALCELVLGEGHPDTADSLLELGWVLNNTGRYNDAEQVFAKTISIYQRTSGPDSPAMANGLNSLAWVYDNLGRHAEAEPLYKRALAIRQRVLGTLHQDTLHTLNNLAWLSSKLGRSADSEMQHRETLAMREQVLGNDHTDVAQSLDNLGGLYVDEGRWDEAEPILRRALDIRERILGPHHPTTAGTLQVLAKLYRRQCRYADAERLYARALAIKEALLGVDHPSTQRLRVLYKSLKQEMSREHDRHV